MTTTSKMISKKKKKSQGNRVITNPQTLRTSQKLTSEAEQMVIFFRTVLPCCPGWSQPCALGDLVSLPSS